jgi:hypothetical protein
MAEEEACQPGLNQLGRYLIASCFVFRCVSCSGRVTA